MPPPAEALVPPRSAALRPETSLFRIAHSGLRRSILLKSFVADVNARIGTMDVSADVKTVPPPLSFTE